MNIKRSAVELIGNTPLVELANIEKELDLKAKILAKIEFLNPAGSSKDRIALKMIADAEKSGRIKKGATIIEPTSGNTGIGLACVAACYGYKSIFVMPENMSIERIKLLKAYGAQVVLTDAKKGMQGSVEKAYELEKQIEGSIVAGQFDNPSNPLAHYETTGPEIIADTENNVDAFVAAIGTGGTISGTAKYLKEQDKSVKVIGVEPADSPLISKGVSGTHDIQGIGANFIPENYDASLVDEIITATTENSFDFARMAAQKEGLLVGISSGAALFAAVKIAKRCEFENKNIVVLLPDGGSRYMSTKLFED